MVEIGLEGLKPRKSGIWGQNNVVLALPGKKHHRFGATEVFFFLS